MTRTLPLLIACTVALALGCADPTADGPNAPEDTIARPPDTLPPEITPHDEPAVSPGPQVRPSERFAAVDSRSVFGTWDGRLFVEWRLGPCGSHWRMSAFRPEAVGADDDGQPDFTSAFSTPHDLDDDCRSPSYVHLELGIGAHPGVEHNPYPSDAAGQPAVDGGYETYDLLVFARQPFDNEPGTPLPHVGRRRVRVVVSAPRTAEAAIASSEWVGAFELLRDTTGALLPPGIDPTLTSDTRLLVFQSDPGGFELVYSYNADPASAEGWSPARPITDMYFVDRDTLIDGIPFHERFPLAKEPLRRVDGTPFTAGEPYIGTYPWIEQDGAALVHTAVMDEDTLPSNAHHARSALMVIGRYTGYAQQHIDGPLNPTRYGWIETSRLFLSGPGISGGFWEPYLDSPETPIPAVELGPSMPLFVLVGQNNDGYVTPRVAYGEVSFHATVDGDYDLFLPMNEMIVTDASAPIRFDLERTPDTSGHYRIASIEGAQFPEERAADVLRLDNAALLASATPAQRVQLEDQILELADRDSSRLGVVGEAMFFGDQARLRVPSDPGLAASRDELSAGLFVAPTFSECGERSLIAQEGAFALRVTCDGVEATVETDAGPTQLDAPLSLETNVFVHLAFSYSGHDGTLRLYRDGERIAEARVEASPVRASDADVIVGPGERGVSGAPTLALDEVSVSSVRRSDREIATTAFRPPTPQGVVQDLGSVALPLGLDVRELSVPEDNIPTDAAIALGERLFDDPALSVDGSMSCATCHDEARAFTEDRARAIGVTGATLPFNTPTVLNRALSSRQFFDGRALTLEEQVLAPVEAGDELGSSIAEALSYVGGDDAYRAMFEVAYGERPSERTMRMALATYIRAQVSGDSRVDRYEAGDRSALSELEQRGRVLFHGAGRCVACHNGSNLTDERFHRTTLAEARPLGRGGITGRARRLGAIKTPTLRDVASTAPYMHDGSVATLEDVVRLYNRGGDAGDALRDPEMRPLGLSDADEAAIVAFLRALDGQ